MRRFRDDLHSLENQVLVDVPHKSVMMCLNEAPWSPLEILGERALDVLNTVPLNLYFHSVTDTLRKALSEYTGVPEEYLMLGNGADEMLYYVFTAVNQCGGFALSLAPSYFDYASYSRAVGLNIRFEHLNEAFLFDPKHYLRSLSDPRCVLGILCNPNNPTGNLFEIPLLEEIVANSPVPVVVDETYFEFSKATLAPLLEKHRHLLLVRSFSKAFGAAGLRFGYLMGHPDSLRHVRKVKTAFNLSLLTQALVLEMLRARGRFLERVRWLCDERDKLCRQLAGLPGCHVSPTHTNFLPFTFGEGTSALFDYLLEHDLALRDIGGHPVLKNHLRVSLSSAQNNALFFSLVKRWAAL